MRKIINGIIICISIILVGFVMIVSVLPNIVLNVMVTLGGFVVPAFLIIITMIIETRKSKDIQEKSQIRNFWLKILFIIYLLLLITVLFLNNEYRMGRFENIIPFSTIIHYISGLLFNNINKSIVIMNFVTNLLLFAPMGFFVPILFKNKIKNIKQFVIMMLILTVFVEILQFITYRGSTDIDDVILNIIGAIIVYIKMKNKIIL